MIQHCRQSDFQAIFDVINDAALAYKDVIPRDCWNDPYMSEEELRREIDSGVVFWGYFEGDRVIGVMGLQHVAGVTLIRHAYTRTAFRRMGIGAQLLAHIRSKTQEPVLLGTWRGARWAIRFYEKNGFRLVRPTEKARLLRQYWTVPDRQIAESVVLADQRWFSTAGSAGKHVLGLV